MFVKNPNVPSEQAICMRRHCKLYSGEIIEFQNVTIAPINQ
jgi:ribosome-associated protein YbcJ (S4-like RNA binding protein)